MRKDIEKASRKYKEDVEKLVKSGKWLGVAKLKEVKGNGKN